VIILKQSIFSRSIYQIIKDEITYLIIKPNQRISEIEIAKRFNVSRTPIRDVFKRLEIEGFLEIMPKKGTFVTKIDLSQLSDMMYLREKIEFAAIEDINGKLDQNQLVKLQFQLANQKCLLDTDAPSFEKAQNFIQQDNNFHSYIFAFAGRPSLWKYMLNIGPHYHRFRILNNLYNIDVLFELLHEHEMIVDNLVKGNLDVLRSIYENHIFGGLNSIARIVSKYPDYFTNTENKF
jgi:GntR family transcriptional regulator, rspAB operon transcriptional repressor